MKKRAQSKIHDTFDNMVKLLHQQRNDLLQRLGNIVDDKYCLLEKQLEILNNLFSQTSVALNVSQKSFTEVFEEIRRVAWSAMPDSSTQMAQLNDRDSEVPSKRARCTEVPLWLQNSDLFKQTT